MRAKKSTKYYQENPEARKKKNEYNKKYHSTPSRRAYRAELNQKNREAGTYGNGDGLDYDHGVRRMIKASTNRAKDRPVKKMQGGGMIKRADGSYSKRGLWDNIRANKGSGKKPTRQMLKQEAKIKKDESKKKGA